MLFVRIQRQNGQQALIGQFHHKSLAGPGALIKSLLQVFLQLDALERDLKALIAGDVAKLEEALRGRGGTVDAGAAGGVGGQGLVMK
jgi:hypothetical protein